MTTIRNIIFAAIALMLAFLVVTRNHVVPITLAPPAPIIEVTEPRPFVVELPMPKPRPAPVAPEPPRAATPVHKAKQVIHAARSRTILVRPDSGGLPVAVPCKRLRDGVNKYGADMVQNFAPQYGYSSDDAARAMKACGI